MSLCRNDAVSWELRWGRRAHSTHLEKGSTAIMMSVDPSGAAGLRPTMVSIHHWVSGILPLAVGKRKGGFRNFAPSNCRGRAEEAALAQSLNMPCHMKFYFRAKYNRVPCGKANLSKYSCIMMGRSYMPGTRLALPASSISHTYPSGFTWQY